MLIVVELDTADVVSVLGLGIRTIRRLGIFVGTGVVGISVGEMRISTLCVVVCCEPITNCLTDGPHWITNMSTRAFAIASAMYGLNVFIEMKNPQTIYASSEFRAHAVDR